MLTDVLGRDRAEEVETVVEPVVSVSQVVTIEKALYGVLVLIAAVIRLLQLNAPPLDAHEAGQALAAYRLATGAGLPTEPYSPLLFTFNFISFALLGAGDALARALPALAGAAIVAVPYWLRRWLGRPGGLATAALLTISPSFVFFSRQLDEAVVTALFTLAALTIGVRYLMTPIPRRLMWLGVWLAVALASGRGAWLFLVIAIGFILAVVYSGRDSVTREDVLAAWRAMRSQRNSWLNAVLLALGVFLTLATAVFFNPDGIQAVFDGLAAWGRPAIDSVGWSHYLLALGVYETLILGLGIVGGIWLLRQRNLFALFLMVWFVVTLLVSEITPARPASGIVTILLPLTLLAGMALGRFADEVRINAAWDREGLFLLFALPFIVGPALQLANFVTQPVTPPGLAGRILLIVALFIVFIAAILSAFAAMMDRAVAYRSAGLLIIILLGLSGLRSMSAVTFPQAYIPQEFLGGPRTSPDVDRVAEQIHMVGLDRFGARQTQPVAVDERLTPTWLWYLRLFPRVEVRNNVAGSTAPLLVAAIPDNGDPPAAPPGYVGQRGRYQTYWTPDGLDLRGWVRWFIYREAPSAPAKQDGFVWFVRPAAAQ